MITTESHMNSGKLFYPPSCAIISTNNITFPLCHASEYESTIILD